MSRIVVRESVLRWWAAIALLLTVWMAAESHGNETVTANLQVWGSVAAAVVSITVIGFYVQILIECVSDPDLPRKWLWLLFLLVIPVVSAFVFFMFSRSMRWQVISGQRQVQGIDFEAVPRVVTKPPISVRRSAGVSLLCVALALLSLAGFGNTWILAVSHRLQLPPWLSVLSALYGVTAGMAGVGLWRMQSWGLRALNTWMAICGLLLICILAALPSRLILGGYMGAAALIVIIGVVFLLLHRYVRQRLPPAA